MSRNFPRRDPRRRDRRFAIPVAAVLPLVLLALAGAPLTAVAWPWSRDMTDGINIKPQAHPMPFPKRSVPVPDTATMIHVADRDDAAKLPNPIPATPESVNKGKALFTIYCTPCHGVSGTGDGLVGEKLVLRPFNLTSPSVQQIPDGLIFGYITFGGAVMPIYGNDLSPTERWHVVNYVRKVFGKDYANSVAAAKAAPAAPAKAASGAKTAAGAPAAALKTASVK
jgi:mono/diheme cytochrome c family protein